MSAQEMRFCKRCQKETLFVRPTTAHVLHFFLSIVTLGWWIIAWVIIGLNNKSQGQCTVCGTTHGVLGSTVGGNNIKAAPSTDTHVKCPDCAELVLKEARKCKHCGLTLAPQ